jgi:hypothetical protein
MQNGNGADPIENPKMIQAVIAVCYSAPIGIKLHLNQICSSAQRERSGRQGRN